MILKRDRCRRFYGIAIGLVVSLALSRFLSSFLFGVRATDPLTFVAVLLVVGALTASHIPAHRATLVDPNVSLRHE